MFLQLMDALKQQEEINLRLRQYMDKVILSILDHNPSILEIKQWARRKTVIMSGRVGSFQLTDLTLQATQDRNCTEENKEKPTRSWTRLLVALGLLAQLNLQSR